MSVPINHESVRKNLFENCGWCKLHRPADCPESGCHWFDISSRIDNQNCSEHAADHRSSTTDDPKSFPQIPPRRVTQLPDRDLMKATKDHNCRKQLPITESKPPVFCPEPPTSSAKCVNANMTAGISDFYPILSFLLQLKTYFTFSSQPTHQY